MKLELVVKSELSHVELVKDEKNPIGLNVRGAKKGAGPAVKNVTPKSPAGRSFAITQGDTVQSVNGQSVIGKKFKDVIRMIKDAGPCANLELQYKLHEIRISRSGVYRQQHLTTKLKKENGSFGFVLRKKDSTEYCRCIKYPIISNIKQGSQVHKDSQLLDGDRLISVDGLNLSWLSLSEIASVLQNKDEAEFTFEYNVRMFDFVGLEQRFDLEIDIPISDLGLNICMHTDATIYVAGIRTGSVAERCGVFSEGDIIFSINDIETNFLTPSKADSLLRNSKKIRKISFIKNIRKEVNAASVSDLDEISSITSAEAERATTETTTSGVETTDWKHVNTPASSNIAFSVQQNFYSQKFCHAEQMEAIEKFQYMVPVMSSLKHDLSQLTDETFNAGLNPLKENCLFCDKTRHSVKLCASCLAKMNIKCEKSLEFLTSIIVQFVNSSTITRSSSPQCAIGKIIGENQSTKFSISSVVAALTETLPKLFPDLQENFEELAEKVHDVDTSCSTCDFEVKSATLLVQKLLLLVSLEDKSEQILDLIDQLVCCLLRTKFTCDGESKHPNSLADDEYNISTSENLSGGEILQDNANASTSSFCSSHDRAERPPPEIQNSNDSIINTSHLKKKTNPDFLKIAYIQSVSDSQNSVSVNEVSGANKADGTSRVKNEVTSLEVNNLENWSVPATSKEKLINTEKEIRSGKEFELTSKVRRAKRFFLRRRKSGKIHTIIQNGGQTIPSESKIANSTRVNDDIPGTSSSTQYLSTDNTNTFTSERDSISSSNRGSTRSSRHAVERERYHWRKRVYAETMEVKLTNDGDGFGLDLSLPFMEDSASVVPVILAIKPKSPSHKSGILMLDDRILAINRQSTLGLTTKDLLKLKKGAFSANSVILTIEFDVTNEEPKFGTFDVILKRTLKTGLIFEAMKKGYAMVVSGVAKGSAAHRSGQLFVGDKIIAIKCNRSEDFDPFTWSYKKDGNVHVAVQRDYDQGVNMNSTGESPCYINPAFSYEDIPRKGTNFAVKRTVVRAVGSAEALVFDQEITLYRDLQFWDFGFLVGESQDTGNAYVIDIRPDGPAHQSGVVKKSDRIVEVNGVSVDSNGENSALMLLAQANHKVDLLIRRLYHEDSKKTVNRHRVRDDV